MNEIQIKKMAETIIDNEEIECEYIEYKKSFDPIIWASIQKQYVHIVIITWDMK